ncbi:MAG: GNAT family N-acetyltransferase [Pseudomonadota bacterium]
MTGSHPEFRVAADRDREALATILLEANQHYWGSDTQASEMTARAAEALLSGGSGCQAILAFRAGAALGFATVSILHPAPSEHGTLFMKDLFISADARGQGLGTLFMRFLAQHAIELGCHRFDWTAESDNPRAIAFYDDLAASRVREKVYFRFSGADLRAFAEHGVPDGPASS